MMCCYCCSILQNWTIYGDSETYINIEVDDLHIMGLKYSSSNQEAVVTNQSQVWVSGGA